MKKNTTLKILVILIIVALCLISFVGIYAKNQNRMENILPEFLLGMNLEGSRVVALAPDTSTKEVIYDSEGKVATDGKNDDGSLKEGYTKKDEPVNIQEVLTSDNFIKVKNIIDKRLEKIGVTEYQVRLNGENGQIVIELPEASDTDEVISNLTYVGKFEIVDADTKEVLIDNSMVKEAKAVYGSQTAGTSVYLSITFNKQGKEKLEEISKTYVKSTDEEGKETTKKVTIALDDDELTSTYFGETMANGVLQLAIGSASTDNTTISNYLKQASSIATLIDSGKLPVTYKVGDNHYVASSINPIMSHFGTYLIVILVVTIFIFILRYKQKGILASLSLIGYVAIFLLALRYTNVVISLEAIVAMIAIFIANACLLDYLLKREKQPIQTTIKQAYIRFCSILVPLLIVAVVFTFTEWLPITSIGMVMFWGLVIMLVYHYLITRTLLDNGEKE